jgi:Spy/CpxP family protein refolding chaperone
MRNKIISRTILILTVFALTGMGASALAGWGAMGYGHHGPMHHGWGHHGPGWKSGGGWGPGYMGNLSDDEIKTLQKERNAFFEATQDLRQEIYQKELELRSEFAKKTPDAKKAAKLQREISNLEADFDQKRLDHQMKMRKISPKAGRGFMGGRPMGSGMMGYGGFGCPDYPSSGQYMGPRRGYGMGPGMMGRGMGPEGGYGRGSGMMGRGQMQGSQQMGSGSQYSQGKGALSKEDAGSIVKDYLASTRNPNLKLGKIKDAGNAFEAEIVTKDNSLVDKVLVDKTSGWMRPAY